ncbi:MAG: DUF6364 family protein [Methanobrevibacter sp.]|jgi:guanylate kinase|nr:DUF6364 family protein [Candidatus Methanovirga aequatorialis]
MQSKNITTLMLDPKIMKTIKQIAINKGTTQTKVINDYLKEAIDREPEKNKIRLKILVEDDPNKNMDELKGIIKTDNPVNAVELINEVRIGE